MSFPRLTSINIKGYRPFCDFTAEVGALEVLVGANGSGKSAFFEFLHFLRDSVDREIPPGIIEITSWRQVFYQLGPEQFEWSINHYFHDDLLVRYQGTVTGPKGWVAVTQESIASYDSKRNELARAARSKENTTAIRNNRLLDIIRFNTSFEQQKNIPEKNSALLISGYREIIDMWMFYDVVNIAYDTIRKPVVVDQKPALREDCGNLSSVLHYLMTEYPDRFDELQDYIGMVVPGFESLNVKARGGPGEVFTFWHERGIETELTLADLSDGVLRLLCWITICVYPQPHSLICIDEPDQGVHPRTLPILAALFKRASEQTQIFLTTHSSYFLKQFDLADIAVMRKEDGQAVFRKPKDSKILQNLLHEFGTDEIEQLHQSDELEHFA